MSRKVTIRVKRGSVKLKDPDGKVTQVVTPDSGPVEMDTQGQTLEYDDNETDFICSTRKLEGDLNADGRVNFDDLALMKNDFFKDESQQ